MARTGTCELPFTHTIFLEEARKACQLTREFELGGLCGGGGSSMQYKFPLFALVFRGWVMLKASHNFVMVWILKNCEFALLTVLARDSCQRRRLRKLNVHVIRKSIQQEHVRMLTFLDRWLIHNYHRSNTDVIAQHTRETVRISTCASRTRPAERKKVYYKSNDDYDGLCRVTPCSLSSSSWLAVCVEGCYHSRKRC